MFCYAQVIGCVVFLIGNVLVNNDLVNVIGVRFPRSARLPVPFAPLAPRLFGSVLITIKGELVAPALVALTQSVVLLPRVFSCGGRPMYENINILVLRSLLVNLTCADPVDDGRTEVTCVIQMQGVAGNAPRPVNFLMMAAVRLGYKKTSTC